jgi:molybdopterin adenylyltransferase
MPDQHPHPDPQPVAVGCSVLTLSDTRTPATDTSGQLIRDLLTQVGHRVIHYAVLPDEPAQLLAELKILGQRSEIAVLILNGGTGISPRDTTYEVIANHLEKPLPGFGELFRWLSFQEVGSRAMASRAIAGVAGQQLVFSLPGSTAAVRLGMERLILPELVHLTRQLGRVP